MANFTFPKHGGDLAYAVHRYGRSPKDWLDLSTGINPRPYPAPQLDPSVFARLPQPAELDALLGAARAAYGVPAEVGLVALPGSELALRQIPSLLRSGAIAVFRHAYSTHADAARAWGRPVASIFSFADVPADTTAVILANPNNPDGRRHDPHELLPVAERLSARRAILVVDEAFADMTPDLSLIPHLGKVRALVLRSFGKFYGLPGLRLGFVAGPPDLLSPLETRVGAWPVNGAALAIATAALRDRAWQDSMRSTLAAETILMQALFQSHGLSIVGGTDLFTLVEHEDAQRLHDGLARLAIWTRVFPDAPRRIRIGLAPSGGLRRLDAALGLLLKQ